MITDKIKTAVIAIPLIILIINWSSVSFFIMILAVVILGLIEFYKLMESNGYYPQKFVGVAGGICLSFTIFLFERRADIRTTGVILTVFLFLFFIVPLIKEDIDGVITSVSVTLLGIFCIAWTISHAILLRDMRPYGRSFIFLLLFSVWSINVIMGWIEKKFGRRKARFKTGINPYARLVTTAVAGVVLVLIWQKILELEYFKQWAVNLEFMSFFHSLAIGLILGISSQVGYMAKSLMKINVEVRDSGELFPGYGGVLDSISSFQFSVPLMYYYVRFFIV